MTKDKEQDKEEKAPVAQEGEGKQDFLMLKEEAVSQDGLDQMSQNAISRIVIRAATEVEGVARFAPKGAGDLLNFFTGKAFDSSLQIRFHKGGMSLSLALNLYYGSYVPTVLEEVRRKVTEQVKSFTGVDVDKVDILVSDLVEPEEPESPAGEEAPQEENKDASQE
ncbi:MAG: Asp23/Gls24 family envelope stress response protein [Oligosphaeraceae bacterium]